VEELFACGERGRRRGGFGCGGGQRELEDAVMAAVGEDEGRPLCELRVVGGEVGLAGEEGGEEVLPGEGEGG